MEPLIRTFIAIKIIPDNQFLQLYSAIKEVLNEDTIKWAEPHNMHLTLRFLGDTTPNQIKKVKLLLEDIAVQLAPFHFNLKGIGCFKNKGKPRILFAKIEESPTLKRLATEINTKVVECGFEKETRDFKPHLTLGRIKFIKERNNFYSLIQRFEETEIQIVKVVEIIFFKSILTSLSPVYKSIQTVQLKL